MKTPQELPKNFFHWSVSSTVLPDGTALYDTPNALVELTPVACPGMPEGSKSLNCQVRVYSHFWQRAWAAVVDVGGRELMRDES